MDHLPKEMDYSLLLPADNSSSEFDNIADLLFISPVIMQRYLEAARKISRLAVGDPNMPVMVNIHRLPVQLPQDARVEDLPFGTRGGLAVDSYFPLDAEYDFKVEMAGYARIPEQVEITVDGERKELAPVGGGARSRRREQTARVSSAGEGWSASGRRDVSSCEPKRWMKPLCGRARAAAGRCRRSARSRSAARFIPLARATRPAGAGFSSAIPAARRTNCLARNRFCLPWRAALIGGR